MFCIREALQKCNCNALDFLLLQRRDEGFDGGFVKRKEHAAFRIDALRYGQAQMTRHQRRRLVQEYVVLRKAMLPADLDQVTESLSCYERCPSALALDQRVRSERRAEYEDAE